MNRKKKINSIYKKRLKKINAKKNPSSKPQYISKALRAKSEAQDCEQTVKTETTEQSE